MATAGRYKYTKIRPTEQIRLLTILPQLTHQDDDKLTSLRCHLDVFDRDAAPEYEALSYTWGDNNRSISIICNSRTVLVTQNCYGALLSLATRSADQPPQSVPSTPRRRFFSSHRRIDSGTVRPQERPKLWIDAICINQEDHRERSGQVTIMGDIFRNALRTVVFLGELEDHRNVRWVRALSDPKVSLLRALALATIDEMRRIEGMVPTTWQHDQDDNILTESETLDIFSDERDFYKQWTYFFDRMWFARTWVVQEALLSRDIKVIWGHVVLDWRTIAIFASIPTHLIRHAQNVASSDSIRSLAEDYQEHGFTKPLVVDSFKIPWPVSWNEKDHGDNRHTISNENMQQVTLSAFHKSGESKFPASRTLFYLLEQSARLECRDPRDKLFALLTLFERDSPEAVAIDYWKAPRTVYLDLSWYLISHGVFEVLSLAKGTPSSGIGGLPSWAIDWTSHPRARRLALNPYAGIPAQQSTKYTGDIVIGKMESALLLRGRLLHDPVNEIEVEATAKMQWFQSFRTKSGVQGYGNRRLQMGDIPCLFKGYDMPILLRARTHNEMGVVDWQLVGECWLTHDETLSRRPGYNMDWSQTFPHVLQSPEQDIWIV